MLRGLLPLLVLLAACGEAIAPAATTMYLSDSVIATLPQLTLVDGAQICRTQAGNGCPRRNAVVNRLDDQQVALWEPGFRPHRFGPGDTILTPIGPADLRREGMVVAITQSGPDRYRLLLVGRGWRVMETNDAGEMLSLDSLPDPGLLAALGFVGKHIVRQRMEGWRDSLGGRLTITRLNRLEDTTGGEVLTLPLPWLQGGTDDAPPVPPLMTATPSWTLTPEGDLIWSPGTHLTVERRTPGGRVRWRVEGGMGPPISEAEYAARDSAVRRAAAGFPYTDEDFAAMRARADSTHAAVSGLTVTPTGIVFVARSVIAQRDSVEFLRLDANGAPDARFTIDKRSRVLLAERDSLLVHRPTEGEPWEVRWVRLQ